MTTANHEEVKCKLAKFGLTYRGDEIDAMTNKEFTDRVVKFNIPNPAEPTCLNGEEVWGLVNGKEDKADYDNDKYFGKLSVILCNTPLYYSDILHWGVEVVIQCNGSNCPILDPEWISSILRKQRCINES